MWTDPLTNCWHEQSSHKNCFDDNGTNKEECSDAHFAWGVEGKHLLIEVKKSKLSILETKLMWLQEGVNMNRICNDFKKHK